MVANSINGLLGDEKEWLSDDIKKLCDGWVEWLEKEKRCSLNTLISYQSDLNDFLKFFSIKGDIYDVLSNIGFNEFRSWLADRITVQNISHRSNSRAMSALRSFFRYLELKNFVHNNKIFFVHKSKQRKKLPKVLSESQISDIAKSTIYSGDRRWLLARDKFILGLLYGSGLRISEALSLTLSSMEGERVKIVGKGNKERWVLVLPIVSGFLKEYIDQCPYIRYHKPGLLTECNKNEEINHAKPLFYSVTGKILSRNLFAVHIQNIRNELGLPEHMTPHAFRHSFATHLFWNGVDIRCIQEALGHASLSSTQVYTHLDTKNMIEMHKKFHPNIGASQNGKENS